MKKILLALAVFSFICAGMAIVGVNNANAYCYSGAGKIAYMYTNTGSTTPYAYIYVSTNQTLPTYYYYFYTSNPTAISELMSAADGRTVQIAGSYSSCPTSGTTRYGGQVVYVYSYHNR